MNNEILEKNIMAVQSYATQTRELLRESDVEIDALKALIGTQQGKIELLTQQIQTLQVRMFTGGATSI